MGNLFWKPATVSNHDVEHTNTGGLCNILKNQKFTQSEGPCLKERLKPDQGPNKFGKIHSDPILVEVYQKDKIKTIKRHTLGP